MKFTYNELYTIYQLVNDEKTKIENLLNNNNYNLLKWQFDKIEYLQNKIFSKMMTIDKTQSMMDINFIKPYGI